MLFYFIIVIRLSFYNFSCRNGLLKLNVDFVYLLIQTVEFLNEKLDKREAQLLSLSKEKALLEEAYDNLKE